MTFCEMHRRSGCPDCPNRHVCKGNAMTKSYMLLYEFEDGRPSFTAKNFDHKPSAESAAAYEKACGGYKKVTVTEQVCIAERNANAGALTIAR